MPSARLAFSLPAALLVLSGPSGRAEAQVAPGPTPTQPQPRPDDEEEKEGPAEQAPETPGELPTTPTLPPPKAERKAFELFELNGYLRFRGDWFKKFHLGFNDDPMAGGAPFPQPLACDAFDDGPCNDTIKSANMRLRMEPIINISERTAVRAVVDVLDNVVLGSTPVGFNGVGDPRPGDIPLEAFSDNQEPPLAGVNSDQDSISVKAAWGEVMTPLGLLKFGRMPTHWGTGMLINSGGTTALHDRIDLFLGQAERDLDSDFGDYVDRVSFSGGIPGTDFLAAIAMDWAGTRPVANQAGLFDNRVFGQPFDLDDKDDVNQWVFSIADISDPEEFEDQVERGEFALDYGAYVAYRTQDFDVSQINLGQLPDAEASYVDRGFQAFIPDVWAHAAFGDFDVELELAGAIGSIDNLSDFGLAQADGSAVDIRQLGGVARFLYGMLDGDLRLGAEFGFASGDQFDNDPQGATHVSNAQTLPDDLMQDDTITAFRFNPDYEIDLILFRELIGTVTNATYIRPSLEYDLTSRIRVRGQSVISFANKPVATPGNDELYGVEFDADAGYAHNGFFAGVAYGVLFPLGALDHPADSPNAGGPGFGYGEGNVGDAKTAQTIQFRLMLEF